MKKFIIDEAFAQAIANYLASRPYAEVADFMEGFKTLKLAPVESPEKVEKKG